MQFMPAHRVRLAMILIAFCGLGAGRLAWTSFRHAWTTRGTGTASRFIAKFEPLRSYLPAGETVGYLPDTPTMDLGMLPLRGRLSLAQYALSPPVVDPSIEHPLVIFESDDPGRTPEMASQLGWKLVADLHNGVKLYRTAVKR